MVLHTLSILILIGSILWIDVPFVRQSDQGCGAASIAMVMQYWSTKGHMVDHKASDQHRIMELLHSTELEGIRADDMKKYFEQHGFHTFGFTGTFEDLTNHISKGRPLIAALSVSGDDDKLHYVVVSGVGLEEGMVLLNDSATRKLSKMTRSEFEERWKATGYWTLLALPAK